MVEILCVHEARIGAVLNSTALIAARSYSGCMSPEPIPAQVVQDFENRWVVLAAILTFSVALLSVMSLLK